MERKNDISYLIAEKEFQKVLANWSSINDQEKAKVCEEYGLSLAELEELHKLWLGLDFQQYQHNTSNIEKALNETIWEIAERKSSSKENYGITRLYHQFSRIAAILIIPIILYSVYIQISTVTISNEGISTQMVSISSQPGTVSNVVLPDGSKVYLNAGSTISYPEKFDDKQRNVMLTGEAYFEVIKNKKVPMVVSTGDVDVKVYGTVFNVNAFDDQAYTRVTLVEGSIALSSDNGKFNGEDEYFVEPGQTVIYYEDVKKLTVNTNDTYQFTAWKDGLLVFRNTNFEDVLKQLSRKFNVDIILKDQKLGSIPMDATFKNENISEILRLLSVGTPFKFYYGNQKKLPDGTFEKSKIYIEKM